MDNFDLQLFGDESPTYTTTTNLQTVTYSTIVTLVGEPAQFGILDKFYLDNMRAALPQDSVTGAINLKQATNQKYQITGAVTGFFEVGGDSASSVTIHAAVGDALNELLDDKFAPLNDKVDNDDFEDYKLQVSNDLDDKLNSSDFEDYKTQASEDLDAKLDSSDFDDYKNEIEAYHAEMDETITNIKGGVHSIQRTNDGSIVFKDFDGFGLFTIAGSSSYTVQSGN